MENKPHKQNDIPVPQLQRMRPEAYGWDLLELEVPGPDEIRRDQHGCQGKGSRTASISNNNYSLKLVPIVHRF
mgnify:CR=1 FL=1